MNKPLSPELLPKMNTYRRATNNFIFYGKGREIFTNSIEDQEITALSLHLIPNSPVCIDTDPLRVTMTSDVNSRNKTFQAASCST